MKNVLLGFFFVYSTAIIGQNLASNSVQSPLKSMVKTVRENKASVEVEKISKNTNNKIYAYLTRVVTSVPKGEIQRKKGIVRVVK